MSALGSASLFTAAAAAVLQGRLRSLTTVLVVMVTVSNTPIGLIRDFPSASGSTRPRTESVVQIQQSFESSVSNTDVEGQYQKTA